MRAAPGLLALAAVSLAAGTVDGRHLHLTHQATAEGRIQVEIPIALAIPSPALNATAESAVGIPTPGLARIDRLRATHRSVAPSPVTSERATTEARSAPDSTPRPGVHTDPRQARDPSIEAGAVATVVVTVPAPAGVDSASYSLQLNPGFRALVPASGRVGRLDDLFLVVATFATPRDLLAGDVEAGTLTLTLDGFDPEPRVLTVRIRERREVVIVLDRDEVLVTPDGETEVRFRLRNRGNVVDTVVVSLERGGQWFASTPAPVVLGPGEERPASLVLTAPPTVTPGERSVLVLAARTRDTETIQVFHTVVVSPAGWIGGLAHVPSRLFVGHGLEGGGGPVITLTGSGRVGPETNVRYELRHWEPGLMEPSLQRHLGGPRIRVDLDRPGLRATAGDMTGYRTTFSSNFRQNRGVRLELTPGGLLSGRVMAGVPTEFNGRLASGHNIYMEASARTGAGTVTVLGGDVQDGERFGLPEIRTTGAGLRWERALGSHTGSVETTLVRTTVGDTIVASGPAVEANYAMRSGPVSGRIRYRTVPGSITAPGGIGNELSGSASARLLTGLHLVGWGHRTEQRQAVHDMQDRSDALSVGLRGRRGPVHVNVGATWSEREMERAGLSSTIGRRGLRTDASYTRGPWSLQADGELGRAFELGQDGDFSMVGASGRWQRGSSWGWVRVQQTTRPGSLLTMRSLQAGGAHALGPVSLSGGAIVTDMGLTTTTTFWSAAEVQVHRMTALHLGVSNRPVGAENDWAVSIGVSRRLNMPLPLARQPDLHGVVFDDANNNGRRDAGEAGVEGVVVRVGHLAARTDEAGRFAFRDAPNLTPSVPSAGLPMGYVLAPGANLRSRGSMDVPLLRTATLELETFLDRNEDGLRDPGEEAGADVLITLTDAEGRQRTATADARGKVRIAGLLPGSYSVTARPPGDRDVAGRDPVVLMEIELAPGAIVTHVLPVPVRSRTIRMGPGSEGLNFFP
jgi:hypothetical protein